MARPVPYENDRLVAAFIGRGSMQESDPRTFLELDISGDGPIALPKGMGHASCSSTSRVTAGRW